jgi:hypothetical protein
MTIHTGKCPKCGRIIDRVDTEAVEIRDGAKSFKGTSFLCPSCRAVLSVGLDPLRFKTELVNETVAALLKKRA